MSLGEPYIKSKSQEVMLTINAGLGLGNVLRKNFIREDKACYIKLPQTTEMLDGASVNIVLENRGFQFLTS